MKLRYILLIAVGVFAALCATLLMAGLRGGGKNQVTVVKPKEAPIIVAAKPLPAMSVITVDAVKIKMVPSDKVPKGAYATAAQIVGKVLSVPVVEGQVYSPACLAVEGSNSYLAAALPPGLRAVTLSLADFSAMKGLLYPGCIVDVLISMKDPKKNDDTVSKTLLKGVEVLAVNTQTVFSRTADKPSNASHQQVGSGRQLVTVMVSNKQAEVLQLAMESGQISLAMRNPLDVGPVSHGRTTLKEMYADMPPSNGYSSWSIARGNSSPSTQPGLSGNAKDPLRLVSHQSGRPMTPAQEPSVWYTTVIRGDTSTVCELSSDPPAELPRQ